MPVSKIASSQVIRVAAYQTTAPSPSRIPSFRTTRAAALSNGGGTLTIENSTISGNTTNFWGGGVFNQDGRLTIANSTISGNRAGEGGGVSNAFGLVFGYSATLILNNSLIAGNQAGVGPEIWNNSIVNANNFNLFGANGNAGVSGFTPGPTDIVPRVPLAQILGPLKSTVVQPRLMLWSPAVQRSMRVILAAAGTVKER